MKELKLAILGFGNAGRSFARLLSSKLVDITEKYNVDIKVVAIVTSSRGSLLDQNGIDLAKACDELEIDGKFVKTNTAYSNITSLDVVKTIDYDIMVELTPLEIFSGQPAIDHMKNAFLRRKHVITANKGPIAFAYSDLKALAEKQNSLFFFETAVMDGTPIFNLVEDTLKFCKVTKVSGILNSTTNFILKELEKGKNYDNIIKEGKNRGFIEADPSMDIEGFDAAAKITALLNVLMDAYITPKDIDRKGIEDITIEDIKSAEAKGCKIKLLSEGFIEDGKVKGSVKPTLVEKENWLANIDGTSSVISITTDLMGTISLISHDPEIEQTAYGIFSDLIRVLDRSIFKVRKNYSHPNNCQKIYFYKKRRFLNEKF